MLGEVAGRRERQDVRLEACQAGIVERLDGGVLDGASVRSAWPLVQGWQGLVSLCSIPFSAQTRSKTWAPRCRLVGPFRFLGRSAKAMPLSVSTVWTA